MAELRPYPLTALLRRATREYDAQGSIFDLPLDKCFVRDDQHDLSVRFHDARASTPLGPAAGPHSQMAQNIALAWLAGSRIIELKTVQINDRLVIPRPCIDMQTVGYNVEWSQELRLDESLEEYVKGSMLVTALAHKLKLPKALTDTVFDMSVGYDLAGIRSPSVQTFMNGMRDASTLVERLRSELPADLAWARDLDYPKKLSGTLTLSTFHGCPPHEIERILEFLLESGLHCIVKLNPTLLGPTALRGLLHDTLGYTDVRVPNSAFEKDTQWDQAVGFVDRLGEKAQKLGLSFGVKFSNTLLVENHRSFFPKSEKEMYLSGPPLHVLAMNLVGRLRETFGNRFPISFSAGIDAKNFADAVALGLVPITVCSDFLKPGGYGRAKNYWKELHRRMDACGAKTIDELVLTAYARGPRPQLPDQVSRDELLARAKLENTRTYVEKATHDPDYAQVKNQKPPKKIGRRLVLFDCTSCDKCIPVCPNDANFTFVLPVREVPVVKLVPGENGLKAVSAGTHAIVEKHQIANFADFCNECGNCDIFCPEDGGPYAIKPRFFGQESDFEKLIHLDGFYLAPGQTKDEVTLERTRARFGGTEYALESTASTCTFRGPGFEVSFDASNPAETARGSITTEADLTYFVIMNEVRRAVLDPSNPNYVQSLAR